VALYAVSETARLEMSQAAHPVEAPVAGRVVATHLVLDREVQGGDVLVELDATAQHLQREEEQARVRALTPQLQALHTVIAAEEQALREARHAGRVALDEARARHREAEVAARTAEEEAAVVPRGDLQVVADFPPPSALGRIWPGQPARYGLRVSPGRIWEPGSHSASRRQ
jgi:multidrug efflux pump subunit AcrA (membrane-fusion protein)